MEDLEFYTLAEEVLSTSPHDPAPLKQQREVFAEVRRRLMQARIAFNVKRLCEICTSGPTVPQHVAYGSNVPPRRQFWHPDAPDLREAVVLHDLTPVSSEGTYLVDLTDEEGTFHTMEFPQPFVEYGGKWTSKFESKVQDWLKKQQAKYLEEMAVRHTRVEQMSTDIKNALQTLHKYGLGLDINAP